MLVKLTDAEILCLHKWLWSDMQKELGNSPRSHERTAYKNHWCDRHNLDICCNCFLCECAVQSSKDYLRDCDICLVVWPLFGKNCVNRNCFYTGFHLLADISDILNLPAKKFDPDRRTKINMLECDIEELKRRMKESDI